MSNKKKTLILVLCYLAYATIYIARLNLSVGSPELLRLGLMTKAQLGLVGSVFSVCYAVGRVVNGYIGDRKSPRFMIVVGLACVAVCNVVIGLTPTFLSVLILWACNAYAQSMLWSSVLRTVASLYDEQTAKKKTAVLVSSVATGNILGILLNTYLIERFGLRYAFLVPGGLALVFGLAILVTAERGRDGVPSPSVPQPFFALLRDRALLRSVTPAMIHGVMKENISLWMTLFFAERYGIDLTAAMGYILLIPTAGFFGRLAYPMLYRLCGYREQRLSAFCFALCVPAAAVLGLFQVTAVLAMACLGLIYAAVSVANTSFLSVFPLCYASKGQVSSVSGLMDLVTYLGGGIGSLVYGLLVEQEGGYSAMFLSFAVLSLVAFGLLFLMQKRVCSPKCGGVSPNDQGVD